MESSDHEDASNSRNQSTGKTPSDALEEKKAKLRKDIQELKELNFQIEYSMNISKFGDIKHLLQAPEPDTCSRSKRIPDVETEYAEDLYRLAGMRCTKFVENEYVFSFYSSGNIVSDDAYAVQIIETLDKPTIGKWVMPMSVDMGRIISETPLDSPMDLKPFLANCRHYIDCYTNRVQQYNELKPIVDDLSGCWLDSRSGHTVVTLKFINVRDLDSEESHNIMLYLIYESNRVRPHKFKIDSLNRRSFTDATLNKFKTYFKYFKCYDLKKAFKKTIDAEDTPVVWENGEGQDVPDSSESSASSSEANFSTNKGKKRSKPRRRGTKRKEMETSRQSHVPENEEELSDESDSGREDDPGPSLSSSVNQRVEKSGGKKGKAQGSKKKRVKAAGPSSAPAVLKKKSIAKKQKVAEKSTELNRSRTNTNLRQSTLGFKEGSVQLQKTGTADRTQLNNVVPLAERIPTAGTSSAKQKSKSNSTLLGNREFGTSTPVSHLIRRKKRFGADNSTVVSPIKKSSNINSKNKQPREKPK